MIDDFKSIIDGSLSTIDDFKSIIDGSRSIIDHSRGDQQMEGESTVGMVIENCTNNLKVHQLLEWQLKLFLGWRLTILGSNFHF